MFIYFSDKKYQLKFNVMEPISTMDYMNTGAWDNNEQVNAAREPKS